MGMHFILFAKKSLTRGVDPGFEQRWIDKNLLKLSMKTCKNKLITYVNRV